MTVPAVCRRVDRQPAPTAAEKREFGVTVERCARCGADIYVSRVVREHAAARFCDLCAPPLVRDALRRLGVPGV